MSKSLRIALAIVEASSLPLLILIVLYTLTGYQMLYPSAYFFPASRALHVDPLLRVIFVVLVYLHSLAGLIIVVERRVRYRLIKKALEYIVIAGLSAFLALAITLDILFK
ncbi:MAG: hypothetical protein QXL96_07250 [Ignisphaera sp.]